MYGGGAKFPEMQESLMIGATTRLSTSEISYVYTYVQN